MRTMSAFAECHEGTEDKKEKYKAYCKFDGTNDFTTFS